jgi:putative ABC transport system ATP-binding protein
MSDPVVVLRGVDKAFDRGRVKALDGLDLDVHAGELLAVTGRSGAGKSTLLHLLAALDRPDRGTIAALGQDLLRLHRPDRYRRNEVGLVFQLHNLLARLDARRNVEMPMFGTHRGRRARRERAVELLAEVDLAGKEHRRPPELSGGERQRVAIARALANAPPLLLADEPTGSLDSAAVQRILELFRRLREQHEVTIVMVTHDPVVANTADRVVEMRDGRMIADHPGALAPAPGEPLVDVGQVREPEISPRRAP